MMLDKAYPRLLHTQFDFGKHQGKTITDVLIEEPSYIRWCLRKVLFFFLEEEAFGVLRKQMRLSAEIVKAQQIKLDLYHNGKFDEIYAPRSRRRSLYEIEEEPDDCYPSGGGCDACGAGRGQGCLSSTDECYNY